MKLPRDLSGDALVRHLCKRWEYVKVHQVGSHVVLQTERPFAHRIAIPAHSHLRVGTLNGILSDVARHKGVAKEDVLDGI